MRLSSRFVGYIQLLLVFFLLVTKVAWALPAEYQQCPIGDSCTIGEFLYDDEYVPITSATCTLTSRDPGGNLFLNAVAMSAAADGWYSYDVTTTGEDAGLYRSQVCCTSGTDYMCIDKTFEMLTPVTSSSSLTAADVWSYSSRSLTDFGSLVDAIWSRSTRTLSNSGVDLTTVNTSLTNIASSIDSLSNQVSSNTTLIEQLEQQVTNNYLTNISNQTIETLTIATSELTTISNETNEIVNSLEGSQFYEEALTLQNAIDQSITTINELQNTKTDDPATIIENYQKSTSELASIISNLTKLKELVEKTETTGSAQANGGVLSSPLGWIGLGLLGLILLIGLVFLVAYVRILLIKQSRSRLATTRQAVEAELHPNSKHAAVNHAPISPFGGANWAKFFSIVLITGSVSALLTGGMLVTVARSEKNKEVANKEHLEQPESQPIILSQSDDEELEIIEATDSAELIAGVLGDSSPAMIEVEGDNMANVRTEGRPDATIVTQLPSGYKIVILEEFDGWLRIEFDSDGRVRRGWIWKELVEY